MRWIALVALMLASSAAPAHAITRLADGAAIHALAVSDGRAHAVLDSDDRRAPWLLVRTKGSSPTDVGVFGAPDSEFPDVADGVVSWSVPVTGGARVEVASFEALESGRSAAFSTGPARLVAGAVAFPDVVGDVMVASFGGPQVKLTRNGPEYRHHPLDAVSTAGQMLVLDLAQSSGLTQLRVLGHGAPRGVVLSVRRVRHIPATLAGTDGLVAVAWLAGGRAHLATARPGGTWRKRRLPGGGGAIGAPAVGIAGGRVFVAYSQRTEGRGGRELFLWRPDGVQRLTTAAGDDRDPHVATGPEGTAFVAWTRRLAGQRTALLSRLD